MNYEKRRGRSTELPSKNKIRKSMYNNACVLLFVLFLFTVILYYKMPIESSGKVPCNPAIRALNSVSSRW